MQAYSIATEIRYTKKFMVTINVEQPENFICDNDDIGSIVKDGIERCWGDVGKVEVEAEEQQ